MKNSKAFTLLKGMPDKEVARLKQAIAGHKRKTLIKLFNCLQLAVVDEEPEAALVYKTVFAKAYTKQQDYLLRNEYRLLYDWLLQQIHSARVVTENETDLHTLTYLLANKQYELFEDEFKACWKRAMKEDDVAFLTRLSDLNIQYHFEGKSQSLPNAEESVALSMQRIALLQSEFLRQVRKEEIRLKMSERVVSAYRQLAFTEPLAMLSLTELEKNDLYAQYLSLRAKINSSKGIEKIELLKGILANEGVIRNYEASPDEALCRFWLNLAQEYYQVSDYKEAITYYAKAEQHLEVLPLPLQESFVLNYIMALMRAESFDEARALADKHAQLMLESKILAGRSPFLLAVLNLYARNAEGAEFYVTLDSKKEGSEFYFFMRLVLSAVYYLRGDIDLAVRESLNVDQAVNYELNREQTLQTRISKPIVTLFRKFYTTLQTTLRQNVAEELDKLLAEINTANSQAGDQSANSILTQWLQREVIRICSNEPR